MRISRILFGATIVGAIALLPRTASTQLAGSVVFTPYAGAYVPANVIGQAFNSQVVARQKSSSAFGANVSYWLNERMAIEAGGVYAKSDIRWNGAIGESGTLLDETLTRSAHVWLASTKLMLQVFPRESEYNMRFGVGPALITRSGPAFKPENGTFSGLTDLGAAFSFCTRLSVTPRVGIRMRAEDYLYQSRLGFRGRTATDAVKLDAKLQSDFLFSTGLQIFLSR